jgi:hypothetical protein
MTVLFVHHVSGQLPIIHEIEAELSAIPNSEGKKGKEEN